MRRQCAPGRVRFRRFPSRAPFAVAAFLAVRVARAAWVPPRGDLACGDAACGGSRASRCARNARVPPRADAAARTDTRTRTGRRFDRSMPSISRISSRTWIVRSSAGAAVVDTTRRPRAKVTATGTPRLFACQERSISRARTDARRPRRRSARLRHAAARPRARQSEESPLLEQGRNGTARTPWGPRRWRISRRRCDAVPPRAARRSSVRPSVSSVARGRDGDGGGPRARSLPPRGTPSRARCHACIFALQQTLAREKTNRTNRIPR